MQTRRHGNGWILATDSTWTDTAPTGGTLERSMSNMHEAFKSWTGDAWGTQISAAKLFATEKAAEEYMKQFANTLDVARK